MKTLDSNTTQDGAPTHHDWINFLQSLPLCLVTIACVFFIVYHSVSLLAALMVGAVLLISSFVALALVRRKYDIIGWHELKIIALPSLPFKARGGLNPLVLEVDHIVWGWKEKILYSEISRVEVQCVNDYFSGFTIHTVNKGRKSFQNWSNSGEPSRTILAVLRERAPHAQFKGLTWIEQGWVPRLGFRHPNSEC